MRFQKIDLRLPGTPKAASIAREVVRGLDDIPEGRSDDLELLVSEVIGNSIRHSDATRSDEISLRMFMGTGQVRVEVEDPGPGFSPPKRAPSPEDTTGRGLFLVDQISDSWGVDARDATTVWFILNV